MPHCSWGLCNSDSKYGPGTKRPRDDMVGVKFIPFPKPKSNGEKCRKWIKLCANEKLSEETITRNTYVCSKHFVGSQGPTDKYPDPLPCNTSQIEVQNFLKKRKRPPPKMRWKQLVRSTQGQDVDTTDSEPCTTVLATEHMDCSPEESSSAAPMEEAQVASTEHGIQTGISLSNMKAYSDDELKDEGKMRRHLVKRDVMKDDKSCRFYTGLSVMKLVFLFQFVQDKASRINFWKGEANTCAVGAPEKGRQRTLSLWEGFLLTLIRIRRGTEIDHLADMFGVSHGTVSKTFTTWLNLLFHEMSFLVAWPTKEQVRKRRPAAFKYFPRTRCIIDCTELFIQRPSIPSSQRRTWSSYKSHNTVKFLVGVTPRGSFSFVSNLWTGNISDRRIVEKSGFLDKIERNDDIMADRGFLIRDLLALRGATLNIPSFSHGKQLAPKATTKTRRIARARIHVERAIGRLKNFKILDGTIPLKLKRHLNQLVQVAAGLSNLDKYLVK